MAQDTPRGDALDPVRIAVIGTGYGGRVALPVYAEMPEFLPVAVWSRRQARAEAAAARAGARLASSDLDEVLAVADLEAVHVATPVAMHAPVIELAARRGLHILCEKPVARDLAEARAVAAVVAETGVQCVVNFSRRFQAARRQLIEAARRTLGTPRHALISLVHADHATPDSRSFGWVHQSALGGGRLQAYGAHDLDLTLRALGPVDGVAAALAVQVPRRRDGEQERAATAEDCYVLLLRLRAGGLAVVSLAATAHHPRAEQIELYGDAGSVRLDADGRLWCGAAGEEMHSSDPLPSDSRAAFREVATRFHAAIRRGAPAEPSLADGLQVQALMDAARRAHRDRGWVTVEAVEAAPPAPGGDPRPPS